MIPREWIDQAALRIAPYIRRTLLSDDAELNIHMKWENQQVTGSFKVRGALNKVLALEPWERKKGLITASAGNHGLGVAFGGTITGTPVLVFVPVNASQSKVDKILALGAKVNFVNGGYDQAEKHAILCAKEQGLIWVSPYNDAHVIAGQGTISREILDDLPSSSRLTWIIPIGGGGLFSGIGAALEMEPIHPRLVGVNASASPFMHSIYHQDSQKDVIERPTLADGLAGALEKDSLTISLVKKYADDLVLVNEEEIGFAMAYAKKKYSEIVEGSGAVSLAAILSGKVNGPAVLIISGGNVSRQIIDGEFQKSMVSV